MPESPQPMAPFIKGTPRLSQPRTIAEKETPARARTHTHTVHGLPEAAGSLEPALVLLPAPVRESALNVQSRPTWGREGARAHS